MKRRRGSKRGQFPRGRGWFTFRPGPTVARAWNVEGWTPPVDHITDDVTTVILSPEYGYELPLEGAEWWQLDLPPRLLDRLADWQARWERDSNYGEPWTDAVAQAAWVAEGHALVDELRERLPRTISVAAEFDA